MTYPEAYKPRRGGKPLIDNETRYEDDFVCRVFVHMYPKGQTLAMVGEMLSLSRERVRQIEERALRKLRANVAALGLEAPEDGPESPYDAVALGVARRHL